MATEQIILPPARVLCQAQREHNFEPGYRFVHVLDEGAAQRRAF